MLVRGEIAYDVCKAILDSLAFLHKIKGLFIIGKILYSEGSSI